MLPSQRRSTRWFAACLLGALITPAAGSARTWRITPDGGGDAPTIQAGLDSAQQGDTVLLGPGTYGWSSQGGTGGSMLHLTPGVSLRGESGAAATILDAELQGRQLRCENVGPVLIEGLTFLNGRQLDPEDTQGGAIEVIGSSNPTLRGCVFRGNQINGDTARGGAVFCDAVTIEDCEFIENRAGVDGASNGFGGAVWCGAAVIRRSTFTDNETLGFRETGGGAVHSFGAQVSDCTFTGNHIECPGFPAGGALVDRGNVTLDRCVFRGNVNTAHYFSADGGAARLGSGVVRDCVFIENVSQAWWSSARGAGLVGNELTVTGSVFIGNVAMGTRPLVPGTGVAVYAHFWSTIENCTLVGNSAGTSEGVAGIDLPEGGNVNRVIVANSLGQASAGAANWSCSVIFGNANGDAIVGIDEGTNRRVDPRFCSDPTATGEVGLAEGSPCAGGFCGLVGAAEVACKATSVESKTWSAMKTLYRSH